MSEVQCGLQPVAEKVLMPGSETGEGLMTEEEVNFALALSGGLLAFAQGLRTGWVKELPSGFGLRPKALSEPVQGAGLELELTGGPEGSGLWRALSGFRQVGLKQMKRGAWE